MGAVKNPSNNFAQWDRYYNPAIFIGNTSIVQAMNVTLATATDSYVYKTGSILAVWGSGGASPGKYVNYKTGGSNGQATAVAILVDTRINNSSATAISEGNPYWAVYGNCNLILSALSTTAGTSADILVALATINARVYNNNFVWIP